MDPIAELKEFLQTEENYMAVADGLFGSKGPSKYDVLEIEENEQGESRKHSKCMKGKQIDVWFREKGNRDICKLPAIPEEQVDIALRIVMNALLENKLLHTAIKRDNSRRIFTDRVSVWDKKYIYSWDYDGPAGMKYLKVALTIAAVIAVPTYRIWPAFLQRIVMRLTLALTVFLIALEVIRFVIFLVCRLFGYSIWIFPDLDRDDKGLLGIFTPFISVEKLEDGKNKYRYTILAVLVALIAIFASNPTKAINTTMAVVHSTTAAVQWVRSEWLMVKLTVVEWIRKMGGSKKVDVEMKTEKPSSSMPKYNFEEDEDGVYDFGDTAYVDEDDMMDMDDLDDVKLEID